MVCISKLYHPSLFRFCIVYCLSDETLFLYLYFYNLTWCSDSHVASFCKLWCQHIEVIKIKCKGILLLVELLFLVSFSNWKNYADQFYHIYFSFMSLLYSINYNNYGLFSSWTVRGAHPTCNIESLNLLFSLPLGLTIP
jgi:hypothetical protein